MKHIRKAVPQDASRIAEILIFAKRTAYRSIFHNDAVSFGEMQVLPLALDYLEGRESLEHIWVYDDEFVRGMLHAEGGEVRELYVDPFFRGTGIGGKLLHFAVEQQDAHFLWVLEKNQKAVAFYQSRGFTPTGERELEPGTPEYIIKMAR